MMSFAERTGLNSDDPQRPQTRYLWTDAFAVCNFLGLARATGIPHYTELAVRLIDRVHHVLGRYRTDDPRSGWLSGLGEEEGQAHPTRGGLRIGKMLPERRPGEPFDEHLEWQRDGQYLHYLTKWMHALDQASRATGQSRFNLWARELAQAAYAAFSYPTHDEHRRLFWKMSTDLSRPLVPSMGHHDPLDGFITCAELQSTASALPRAGEGDEPSLESELVGFSSMIEGGDWATADPLGLGGLLTDAGRVEQLRGGGVLPIDNLARTLLAAALDGLRHYVRQNDLHQASSARLAFRELGLGIGLHAVDLMTDPRALLDALRPYVALGSAIESFWDDRAHRANPTWSSHRDINEVMLATSLAPEGLLVLAPSASS
jgi:hypothetical protein